MNWLRAHECESNTCVEVAFTKSSYSSESANCVEVGCCDSTVKIRDSKDPGGPVLTFSHDDWTAFVAGVRNDEFDLPS